MQDRIATWSNKHQSFQFQRAHEWTTTKLVKSHATYLNRFPLALSNDCMRATSSLCVDFKNVKMLSIEPIFLSSNFVKYRRSSNRIRIVQCFSFSYFKYQKCETTWPFEMLNFSVWEKKRLPVWPAHFDRIYNGHQQVKSMPLLATATHWLNEFSAAYFFQRVRLTIPTLV